MANKFVIVPQDIYRGLTTPESGNINLDFLRNALEKTQKSRVNASSKNIRYNQELRRYLRIRKELEDKPTNVSITNMDQFSNRPLPNPPAPPPSLHPPPPIQQPSRGTSVASFHTPHQSILESRSTPHQSILESRSASSTRRRAETVENDGQASQFPSISELEDEVFEPPRRREERISRDRSPISFRPKKWARVQYSPEPDLTVKRQLKKDRTRRQPPQSIPATEESETSFPTTPEPNFSQRVEARREERISRDRSPVSFRVQYSPGPVKRQLKKDRRIRQQPESNAPEEIEAPFPTTPEPEHPYFIGPSPPTGIFEPPKNSRALRPKKKPKKSIRPKKKVQRRLENTGQQISMPDQTDYHFFTPGARNAIFGDSMPIKKHRPNMEYQMHTMPELSAFRQPPVALTAGQSSAAIEAPAIGALTSTHQNAALPAPKSMLAIAGPSQLSLTAPLRGRDRRILREGYEYELSPEYQIALRELRDLVPRNSVKRPRRGQAIPLEDFQPKRLRL